MGLYNTENPRKLADLIEQKPFLMRILQSGARARAADVIRDLNLSKNINSSDRLLYVGAGTGHIPQLIAEQTRADVVSVDLEDLRTSDTKNVPFVKANAVNLPFEANSLDAVVFVDMLHHCPDQDSILKEAHRVLKDGGKMLIHEETIPSKTQPKSRVFVKKMISIVDDLINFQPPGVNPYNFRSSDEWKEFAESCGFHYLDSNSHNWGLYDLLPNLVRPKRTIKRSAGRFFETTGFVFEK